MAAVVFALAWQAAAAAVLPATPSDYRATLRKLQPGDTLRLEAGTYTEGLPVHGLVGAAGKPIVIRGPMSGPRARFVARKTGNTVSIVNSAWVEIRNLELDGAGLPVAAVRAEGHADWAHHITLDGLLIRGHGIYQGTVGIGTFCPAWGWVIRNNTIIAAGTGMYLGQSDGSAPFVGGLIERNVVVDSIGYNLQIKHQRVRAAVEGMPETPALTIIRHNVFSKANNGAIGERARPNLLVGHWPPVGPGSEDTYAIYGNFFHQNPTEALFQGEGNIAFYGNVLVNTLGDAIHVQPHNHVPRRVDIFSNTILAAHNGIRVTGGDPAYHQRVVANAVFAAFPIAGGETHANVTGLLSAAGEHLADPYAAPGRLDLSPLPGRLAIAPFSVKPARPLPDQGRDFEGRRYAAHMAGAYAGSGAAWKLQLEPKPVLKNK